MSQTMAENFKPLVELLVISPQGELLGARSVNEDILDRFVNSENREEAEEEYLLQFLAEAGGLENAP